MKNFDNGMKYYLDVEASSGKIIAVHESYTEMPESFILFDPPEGWDSINYVNYIYQGGELVPITREQTIALYFDGVDPVVQEELERQKKEQEEQLQFMLRMKEFRSLTDEEAVFVYLILPEWKAGVTYQVGDRVQHEYRIFRCLTKHKATEDDEPIANENWLELEV